MSQHDDLRPGAGDLTAALAALRDALEGARAMPMSSSVLVHRAEVLELLDRAEAALPQQLGEADEVLASADHVLLEARARAEEIVAAARRRADELVSADAVVVAARHRAAELEAEAGRTAAELRRDADDYCDRRLADFEIDLGRVLAQVQAGRTKLADRLEDDAPGG